MGNGRALSALLFFSVTGCPAPSAPTDAGAAEAGPPCATAADCDDGRYCNGEEACMPASADADERGCAPGAPPCLESQRCEEEEGRCLSHCAIAPDADADGFDSVTCGGADCDDTDPRRNPGETEVCDAEDLDEDCQGGTFGTRDADGDGHVDAACCNDDDGTMRCGDDCNDGRRDAHPGATEACERIDNDCDGSVDEMLTVMAWPDEDLDLHGVADDSRRAEVCPGTPGFSTVRDDCDDTSPLRHGAQLEICDAVDNDCDGTVDEAPVSIAWYLDQDGDLFGAPDETMPNGGVVVSCTPVEGMSPRSSDCDDGDALVRPGARELCNGVDDDCNGFADAGTSSGDGEDDDADGYPDVRCGGNDCDDAQTDVHPMAPELCNMRDDDCDLVVDGASAMAEWYLDLDRDGFGDVSSTPITSCEPQPGRVPNDDDCEDGDASRRPGVADPCDPGTARVDQDCDGRVDEGGIRFAFFTDADADGFGTGTPMFACRVRPGLAALPGDCDDEDDVLHPGALETCDLMDEDCDTTVDEDSERPYFVDLDLDGHGSGTPVLACIPPADRVALGDDCDDADAANFPGNVEACNGRDDDCDSVVDDGAMASCSGFSFATGVCTAGACVLTCDADHADCDAEVGTGCEADLRRSPAHCGGCGMACHPGDTCGMRAPSTCDLSPVVSIATAGSHALAVRASGGLITWGDATSGAALLGTDAAEPRRSAVTGAVMVSTADDSSCVVTTARRVLCWGYNSNGELGDGTSTARLSPGPVLGITDAVEVRVGDGHACALHTGGGVSCWGNDSGGAVGSGVPTLHLEPYRLPGIGDAVDLSVGTNHTCVLRGPAGSRYVTCWGSNSYGECGVGDFAANAEPGASVIGLPTNVVGLSTGVAGGTCAWTADGFAYCWGANQGYYSLGLGSSLGSLPSAILMPSMTNVVEVSLGVYEGCLRRREGTATQLWCWGYQSTAWIDGVTSGTQYEPIRAADATGPIDDAVAIAVDDLRWYAVRATGRVTVRGWDDSGQRGDGPPFDSDSEAGDLVDVP